MDHFYKKNGTSFIKYVINLNFLNSCILYSFIIVVSYGVANLKVPITAKIRVFDEIDKTVEYAKMVESTGVSVIWCVLTSYEVNIINFTS